MKMWYADIGSSLQVLSSIDNSDFFHIDMNLWLSGLVHVKGHWRHELWLSG